MLDAGSPARSGAQSNRRKIDAHHAVPPRSTLLRCSHETVEPAYDRNVAESRGCEHGDDLCFQQSPGNSTRPEVDVAQRAVRQRRPDDDVGDLHTTAGLEHASDLGDGPFLFGHQVQDAVGDNHVDAAVLDR